MTPGNWGHNELASGGTYSESRSVPGHTPVLLLMSAPNKAVVIGVGGAGGRLVRLVPAQGTEFVPIVWLGPRSSFPRST